MSLPWQQIRGAHIDPSAIRFTNLLNKQNMFENELFKAPPKQIGIISSDTHDRMAYNDRYFFNKLKYKTTQYYMPFEPDGKYLKLWCRFNHLARKVKDYSMATNLEDYPTITTNQILLHGDPILCRGPDDGVKGGTIVTRLNSKDSTDYYQVLNPESYNIGVAAATTGFSIYLDFMLEGDPVQDNGEDPTLWFHVDDPGGDYGTMVKVGEDRSLKFFVKRAGTVRNFISEPNKITSGIFHTACLRYNLTGNLMFMKIDNITSADSANETPTFPTDHESGVFWGIGSFADAGRFPGRFKDFRLYQDLIFTYPQEENIWRNKRTIGGRPGIQFDGVNDYLDLGADTGVWSKNISKFSISIWVKPTKVGDVDYRTFLGLADIAPNDAEISMYFIKANVDGQPYNAIGCDISNDDYATVNIRFSAGEVFQNRLYNVILTYDNTLTGNCLRLYVDGVLQSNANDYGDNYNTKVLDINAATKMLLGTYTAADVDEFAGIARDFRYWDGIALTQTQASQVRMNNPDAPAPSYWLPMTEGTGNPVDIISGTKSGTLVNGAFWNLNTIEYGTLDVIGYARFNDQVFTSGFDATGFDSTGFDTS